MKKRYIILSYLLLFLLLACQPTPDEEVVKNRLDGTLLSAVAARPVEPYRYEAPERWTEEMEVRGQPIHIDATIELDEANQYPILTIKRKAFDRDEVVRLTTLLLGEKLEIREGDRSYDELLEDLMFVERGAATDVDEETGEIIYEPYDGQEDEINELKAQLADTPPYETYHELTADRLLFPCKGQVVRDADGNNWYIRCGSDFYNVVRYRKCMLQWENEVMTYDGGYMGEGGHTLENIRISEEEAIQAGMQFLAKLNRSDFVLADIERARLLQGDTHITQGEGYSLYYVSCTNGCIPVDYSNKGDCSGLSFTKADQQTAHAKPWAQEEICLMVTEEGVVYFTWRYPKEIVLTANENASLLPFEEIQKSIRRYLEIGLNGKNNPITIERIVLSAAIQQAPDQGDEAFLAPVWVVYLHSEIDQKLNARQAVFLISALDGIYVSRVGRFG